MDRERKCRGKGGFIRRIGERAVDDFGAKVYANKMELTLRIDRTLLFCNSIIYDCVYCASDAQLRDAQRFMAHFYIIRIYSTLLFFYLPLRKRAGINFRKSHFPLIRAQL